VISSPPDALVANQLIALVANQASAGRQPGFGRALVA